MPDVALYPFNALVRTPLNIKGLELFKSGLYTVNPTFKPEMKYINLVIEVFPLAKSLLSEKV